MAAKLNGTTDGAAATEGASRGRGRAAAAAENVEEKNPFRGKKKPELVLDCLDRKLDPHGTIPVLLERLWEFAKREALEKKVAEANANLAALDAGRAAGQPAAGTGPVANS